MSPLLADRFAPITFAWAFLETTVEDSSVAIVNWRREHHRAVDSQSIEAPLGEALRLLEPLTTLRRRELLIATRSSWTAYFDNSSRGGDPFGTASHLARTMKCRALSVRCVSSAHLGVESTRDVYDAVQFELFGPESREWLNYERAIGVSNDGGRWVFINVGKPLPFERRGPYTKKRIKNRFTPEMLEEYCAALGIRLFDAGFYGGKAALVTIRDPLPEGHAVIPLNEARASIGLSGPAIK